MSTKLKMEGRAAAAIKAIRLAFAAHARGDISRGERERIVDAQALILAGIGISDRRLELELAGLPNWIMSKVHIAHRNPHRLRPGRDA